MLTPTPPHLLRLMAVPRLPANVRLEPELAVSVAFANRLRAACVERRYTGIWFHVPNEGSGGRSSDDRRALRARIEGAKQRAAGVLRGVADFVLVWRRPADGLLDAGAIELKAGYNRPTEAQEDFLAWARASGLHAAVHTDALAAWRDLVAWGAVAA